MLTEFDMPMEYQLLLGAIRYEWDRLKVAKVEFPAIRRVCGLPIGSQDRVRIWNRGFGGVFPKPLGGIGIYFNERAWLRMCLGDYTTLSGLRIDVGHNPDYRARKVNPKKIAKALRLLF